jgi:hypothetical protein
MAPGPHEPADLLTDRRGQDLLGLRDRDRRLPESGHTVAYTRMDDLARRLVIARGDGIGHQKLLNELSDVDLPVIDDFLTVGFDPEAANDLFAVLAIREHRLPTLIVSQSGPAYWVEALPDQMAADSIVNRLANNARQLNLGDVDMRQLRGDRAPVPSRTPGNKPHPGHGADPEQTSEGPVPSSRNPSTNYPDQQYQQKLSATPTVFSSTTND